MNLYVVRPLSGQGHICAGTNVDLVDAESRRVGFVTPAVADWLVTKGIAMDITEPVK